MKGRPPINIAGIKHGRWMPIEYISNGKKWRCICDCGVERLIGSFDIKTGRDVLCKNCRNKGYVGMKFGKWTAMQISEKSKVGRIKLDCMCDCGNVASVDITCLRAGRSTQCKSCVTKKEFGASAFLRVISQYKRQAKERGLEWGLTEKQFIEITQSNCHYTGLPPSSITRTPGGEYRYNGIDRVDNNIGYIYENCVPCAGPINIMKGGMSYEQFTSYCHLISSNLKSNKQGAISLYKVA